MVPGYPGTLGRRAWLHVRFREISLSPSGRLRCRRSHPFPNSLGRNNVRSQQSDPPKNMDGHNRGPWTLTRAPQPGSRAGGDLALVLKSCCSSDACGPQELVTPIQRLLSSCGVHRRQCQSPGSEGTRGEMRRHIQREPLPSSPQQGSRGGKSGGGFLRATPGVW